MNSQYIRVGAIILAILLLTPVASAFITDQFQDTNQAKRVEEISGAERGGYTAITTQQFRQTYPESELIVVAPNGSTTYVNSEWSTYFDVDPVPGRPNLVEYVAAEHLSSDECYNAESCTRNVFVRENFRTGESTVLWSRVYPGVHSSRTHDVDRINNSHIAVADIHLDQVFIYDLNQDVRVWTWSAQRDYPLSSGGPWPNDWTHMNDVEVLEDGRLMVSLRNQDSVVFLNRNGSLMSSATLGEDGNHDIIYEQHNPDYIDSSPPSVIIADSENNRIVEYQRQNDSWTLIWGWQDDQIQWPRDADRLPNGHTLITDSNGNRVFEVNRSGRIIWSVDVGLPYEAERLSTGDESAGGPSASEASLTSRIDSQSHSKSENQNRGISIKTVIKSIIPLSIQQAVAFVMPSWMGFWHVFLVGLAVIDLFLLTGWEVYHSRLRLQLPVTRK